jgi:hypothetical protein
MILGTKKVRRYHAKHNRRRARRGGELTVGGDGEGIPVQGELMSCSHEVMQCSPVVKKRKPGVFSFSWCAQTAASASCPPFSPLSLLFLPLLLSPLSCGVGDDSATRVAVERMEATKAAARGSYSRAWPLLGSERWGGMEEYVEGSDVPCARVRA